jgi:putative flavoprotein involved in K+ transport
MPIVAGGNVEHSGDGEFPATPAHSSTVVDGLYFVGVPFMRTRKSPLLLGVAEDAAVVAASIAGVALPA